MIIFCFLGVSPPCCSILCQFWLCEEAQCVYLRRHLGSLDICFKWAYYNKQKTNVIKVVMLKEANDPHLIVVKCLSKKLMPFLLMLLLLCKTELRECVFITSNLLHFRQWWGIYYIDSYFLIYLLIMLLQLSYFPHFTPLHPAHSLPPTFPPYSSCPWVILISSLASTFTTLFYPPPVYFLPTNYATYSLYLSPLSPPPTPLLITCHMISISVVLFLF